MKFLFSILYYLNIEWKMAQIVCCEGWDILHVWGSSWQFGQLETTIRTGQVRQWSTLGHRGLQSSTWQSTLPSQSRCWPSQWELRFHCLWQIHFYPLCGLRNQSYLLLTQFSLMTPHLALSLIFIHAHFWQDQFGKVPLFWGITADGYVAFADDAELLKGACGKSLASFPQGGFIW